MLAQYTVELGKLIESKFDIGLTDYPIYNEQHREELNNKIIEHFYFREIGLETPQLFKRFLNRKMAEIMPYYNQMYKSEDVKFNPLYNIEITETFERTGNTKGNTKSDSNMNSNSKTNAIDNSYQNSGGENISVTSDTPDTQVSIEDIKNSKYASNTGYQTGSSNNSENKNSETNEDTNVNNVNTIDNTQDTSENYTKKTEGSSAGLPFSKAIKQWREIMLNIDMQIIEELECLFMGLY